MCINSSNTIKKGLVYVQTHYTLVVCVRKIINMEYICLGNNLYVKINLKQDKIGNCRFWSHPKIKSVHYCMDNKINVYAAVNKSTPTEYVKLELEIYNPDKSRCCIEIGKEDGESEIF